METENEIFYYFTEDGTDDLILTQNEDQIRMDKQVSLKLAWEILNYYTENE